MIKWARRQRQLEADENLFGLFVSAHLEALKTRDNLAKRAESKIRLLRNLRDRGLTESDQGNWYRLIDWILPLPEDWERQVFQRVQGDKVVTYITFAERQAMRQGSRRLLQAALKAKFGTEGEALMAQLPEETPVDRLEILAAQVAVASAIDWLTPLFIQS